MLVFPLWFVCETQTVTSLRRVGISGLFNEGYRFGLSQRFGGGQRALDQNPPARAHLARFDDFEARIFGRAHGVDRICSVVERHAELQDAPGGHLPAVL